ncbi:hypothetical protein MED217_00825 [Leeuwenhoekiella blandensis MED217]|uniref:Uncharacterized protein n=1 Tax=Leeuwenhoekiella blandensis (strain CECT 7118 / CCUG 51940 / KCTC 22103 / MED217) TaxID=398720 RepID=A3XQ80_LEEBM|nr:hypothetical protein MED217_00825 [Leeuwenhoekiella blandensis MED217]
MKKSIYFVLVIRKLKNAFVTHYLNFNINDYV